MTLAGVRCLKNKTKLTELIVLALLEMNVVQSNVNRSTGTARMIQQR